MQQEQPSSTVSTVVEQTNKRRTGMAHDVKDTRGKGGMKEEEQWTLVLQRVNMDNAFRTKDDHSTLKKQ